jgi:hypothetical protein
VHVRDDDGAEVAHDLFGWHGQWNQWISTRVPCVLDRRTRANVAEHRLDKDAAALDFE